MNTTGKLTLEAPSPSIYTMDQEFFPGPWTFEQWDQLNLNHHKLYTWKEDQNLLGFALFGVLPNDSIAHLYKVLIHPDKRGTRSSMCFWAELVLNLKKEGIKTVYLEVAAENPRAIGFYEKNGFKLVRKIRAYYSNGDDALVMTLTL